MHPETFVLCAIASLHLSRYYFRMCLAVILWLAKHVLIFQFSERGERDAKSVVNPGLRVFCVVVHSTDHYGNHWISRECPVIFNRHYLIIGKNARDFSDSTCYVFQTSENISHHQIKGFKYIVTRTHNSSQQQSKRYQNTKGVC